MPVAADGTLPGLHYVVRTKGQVELATFSCATCHTRVLAAGVTIRGTQGNLPLARIEAVEIRAGVLGSEAEVRRQTAEYHGTPWVTDGPNSRLRALTIEEFAAARDACPPGVYPNHNGGVLTPAHAAELRGVRDRRYPDCTGHMRHRGPADLMGFSDFHQSGSAYASFGRFRPQPAVTPEGQERYSDEQAYALARYVYSLTPPVHPDPPRTPEAKARVARGREVFMDAGNRCAACHDPAQGYTNNKLTPVDGFTAPADHPERAHVMPRSVHTDPTLALARVRRSRASQSWTGVWAECRKSRTAVNRLLGRIPAACRAGLSITKKLPEQIVRTFALGREHTEAAEWAACAVDTAQSPAGCRPAAHCSDGMPPSSVKDRWSTRSRTRIGRNCSPFRQRARRPVGVRDGGPPEADLVFDPGGAPLA